MRIVFCFILCLISNVGFVNAEQPLTLSPYFTALIVTDMDRSIDWYQNQLGLTLLSHADMMQQRGFRQANLKRDGLLVELIQTDKTYHQHQLLADKPKKSKVAGFFKLGFSVENFDAWLNWIDKRQIKHLGSTVKDPLSGKRTLLILDPDGNRLQLFER